MAFVLVSNITRWPNATQRFTKADQSILAPYFDAEPFWAREWDIFHYETSTKDHFLLSLDQVQSFLEDVHQQTGLTRNLHSVPPKQLLFRIPHTEDSPPACIGTSTSKAEYDALHETYAWKRDDMAVRPKDNKASKAKKAKEKRHLMQQGWRSQVRTARKVLGMGNKEFPSDEIPGESIELPHGKPVLVAIDVEAWEKDNNKVTEIGLAILDTLKIPSASELPQKTMADIDPTEYDDTHPAPRTRADAICELIEYRHFRISDHKYMRNGQWVADCADRFDFGESEWVSLKDVPSILGSCLRHCDAETGEKRKLMLVGHDIKQDLQYLRITGYDVWNIKDLEVLDTGALYRAVQRSTETRSLAKVLTDLGVVYWNLHNAGNDAAYTLQAFIRLADRGISHKRGEDETPSPPPSPQPADGQETYPDYEDLVASGCIKYVDVEKEALGFPVRKEGRKGRSKPREQTREERELQELDQMWNHSENAEIVVEKIGYMAVHDDGW